MSTIAYLRTLAANIKTASDLWDLHQALIAFENAIEERDGEREADPETELRFRGVDICELPTFGGPDPKSTVEVWSWDADHILCGIGPFREWTIRERRS